MTQVSDLEKQLSDAKILAERQQKALRLYENKDFRELIVEGFCTKDAARYVQESGDPMLKPEERADALNIAQASGHLRRYLSVIVTMGSVAAGNIADIEQALDEVRAEEVEEG